MKKILLTVCISFFCLDSYASEMPDYVRSRAALHTAMEVVENDDYTADFYQVERILGSSYSYNIKTEDCIYSIDVKDEPTSKKLKERINISGDFYDPKGYIKSKSCK